MSTLVVTPKRAQERQLIANLKKAWSLRPGDQFAELKDGHGRRLTYPKNHDLHHACVNRMAQQRRAKQAQVTPNVCLSLPLFGMALVPTPVIRFQ